jgi:NTP pyrophosphatase (non-canonical NTP hydrolase)
VSALSEEYQAFLLDVEARLGGIPIGDRLIWLAAEVGEVMDAYMGMVGTNPRKGVTHSQVDLAAELADVAMTALASITTLGLDAEFFMSQNMKKVRDRIAE